MGKLVTYLSCPLCHRQQALKDGQTVPVLWFDTFDLSILDFVRISEAVGGQGRGVKGKIKAESGFVLVGNKTLEQAYRDPSHRDAVTRLYQSSKALVTYLEGIGVH